MEAFRSWSEHMDTLVSLLLTRLQAMIDHEGGWTGSECLKKYYIKSYCFIDPKQFIILFSVFKVVIHGNTVLWKM